jgi:trehalose synthase
VREIEPTVVRLDSLDSVLGAERFESFAEAMRRAADRLSGRTLWHVNSTGEGGGVAEILQSALGYLVALDVDARWAVIEADDDFFTLTKRVHNMLHGADGDTLDENDRALYERTLNADQDGSDTRPKGGDVVVLHDPQTVGLASRLREEGCSVLWSCHVGADEPTGPVKAAWEFLLPYARATEAQVFSRRAYAWDGLDEDRIEVIPPCIDASAVKNEDLGDGAVRAILDAAGLVPSNDGSSPRFTHPDGSEGTVERRAEVIESAPIDPDAPIVLQVSRWDALKDPIGVLKGFVDHVPVESGAHLFLAGPAAGSVDDDPEGKRVLDAVRKEWEAVGDARVHLACLPMDDIDENAAIVNALQRRADVVVQKSKAEGFGLTVAEAMWKSRPVVGSRVGGIQDQIEDGRNGLLVEPEDLPAFGEAVTHLLDDRDSAQRIGAAARERVSEEYLADRYLTRWMQLIERTIT